MDAKEYYQRFQGKTCKRFPVGEPLSTLRDAHRIKMKMKTIIRERARPPAAPLILANISVNHKDYGMSPVEHEQSKNNS